MSRCCSIWKRDEKIMIKRCKQCNSILTPDESNNFCKNCREGKKDRQAEARILAAEMKKKKYQK
jgi:uncharacterized OB-fold protein